MASSNQRFEQRAYPNLKINISSVSNKRRVSFLGDDLHSDHSEEEDSDHSNDPVSYENVHLQMTILNPPPQPPPRKKRRLSREPPPNPTVPTPPRKRVVPTEVTHVNGTSEIADYGDLEDHEEGENEDDDLNHNPFRNTNHNGDNTETVQDFKDFEDKDAITIAKAIKIIQKQQVQSLGLFEKLLHEKSMKNGKEKSQRNKNGKSRKSQEGQRERSVTPETVCRSPTAIKSSKMSKSSKMKKSVKVNGSTENKGRRRIKRVRPDFEYIAPVNDNVDDVKFKVVI